MSVSSLSSLWYVMVRGRCKVTMLCVFVCAAVETLPLHTFLCAENSGSRKMGLSFLLHHCRQIKLTNCIFTQCVGCSLYYLVYLSTALFEPSDLRFEVERDPSMDPSIVETTEKAIRILQKNPNGFFLLVEGEERSFTNLIHTSHQLLCSEFGN